MKRINRMLFVAFAFLAPLAARADLVGPWAPRTGLRETLLKSVPARRNP